MDPKRNIIELLELCIVKNTNAAWEEFINRYAAVISGVYFKHKYTARNTDIFKEFTLWFPGWLYHENKIQTAYRALKKKTDEEELHSPDEQEKFFSVYFSKIVMTGCAEFGKERGKTSSFLELHPDCAGSEMTSPNPGDDAVEQKRRIIKEAIAALPPDQRVPFLLRYYDLVWPLEEQDLKWGAEEAEVTISAFITAVEKEGARQPGKQYPISGRFIGELLRIPPDVNGKYVTVDQRIYRVKEKIKKALLAAAGEAPVC